MEQVTQLSVAAMSAVLLGYGIGGFFGNFAGGWLAGRSERHAIVAGGAVIAVLAASLLVGRQLAVVTAVAVTLWGFAFGAFPVGFQTWIVRAAPDQAEARGRAAGGGVPDRHRQRRHRRRPDWWTMWAPWARRRLPWWP